MGNLSRQEYEEIVHEYGGKMTDAALARKYDCSTAMIRKTRIRLKIKSYKMSEMEKSSVGKHKANICFDCRNALDIKKCIWARTLSKYPTVIDENGIEQSCTFGECGNIMDCPIYEPDEIHN